MIERLSEKAFRMTDASKTESQWVVENAKRLMELWPGDSRNQAIRQLLERIEQLETALRERGEPERKAVIHERPIGEQ